jgi:hypothetical protein
MISQSTIVRDHSTNTAVDPGMDNRHWWASGIAIYAVAASPAPDPDAVIAMTVQP